MVRDLRLKKGEHLVVSRRGTKELPEKELLTEDNSQLTPECRAVFEEIFGEYSTDGKMNKEQCARFVTGCTGNPCSQDDYQISKVGCH
jgi:ubiquitin carboxyl-terminal hydrolase 34